MNDFIYAVSWIVNTCLSELWQLVISYWIIAIFVLIGIIGAIASLVTFTREQ